MKYSKQQSTRTVVGLIVLVIMLCSCCWLVVANSTTQQQQLENSITKHDLKLLKILAKLSRGKLMKELGEKFTHDNTILAGKCFY